MPRTVVLKRLSMVHNVRDPKFLASFALTLTNTQRYFPELPCAIFQQFKCKSRHRSIYSQESSPCGGLDNTYLSSSGLSDKPKLSSPKSPEEPMSVLGLLIEHAEGSSKSPHGQVFTTHEWCFCHKVYMEPLPLGLLQLLNLFKIPLYQTARYCITTDHCPCAP